ncbi:MAG: hypothetical protein DMG72_07020, partial [Acidobacteria bacterium]
PAYAPELNPVEYLWSHWKQYELPDFCPTTFGQLSHYARKALRRMRRRPTLVIAFWQHADLCRCNYIMQCSIVQKHYCSVSVICPNIRQSLLGVPCNFRLLSGSLRSFCQHCW